jgi:hypothetical protein
MDINDDVRYGITHELLTVLGLQEVILDHTANLSPPATMNCNNSRQPIDGIWATAGIHIQQDGYLEYGGVCLSNHRALWIDVHFKDGFGDSTLSTVCPSA